MDEGGGALVGKVDQSGPRKITASKSVRWPMGGGFGRRQQSFLLINFGKIHFVDTREAQLPEPPPIGHLS